ncbi:hypothetical protein [Aurantimonas sp. VKM B-3413]|uniref:hypothetical protein n=1 Tax=Aurantimonas sp. VKM B-3413 TaxID=2779401 RepID=UPI001E4F1D74|nr:hypothetical protein [Aurantimonas sp. VKM B-3413]MCB8840035.1 hypothetical protein [Aurantimonas sp. VKM B-3413]
MTDKNWKRLHPIDDIAERSASLQEMRRSICSAIPCYPDTDAVREQLAKMSFNELLCRYMNWVDRVIAPRKREALIWEGFWSRGTPAKFASSLNAIIDLSREGENLKPFLSERVDKIGFAPRDQKRRGINWGDKDRALNAYGVHHLHLKPVSQKGGRSGGSKELLFASFSRTHMLLLMLGDHNSFDDGKVRQAVSDMMADNDRHIRGIEEPSRVVTSAEGAKLVIQGVNTFGASQGKFTMPTSITSSGAATAHVRHADAITIAIEDIDLKLQSSEGEDWIRHHVGDKMPRDPDWGWGLWYGDLFLVDRRTKRGVLCVTPWQR